MAPDFVRIQGVPVPQGEPPGVRREFSTWSTDPEATIQVSLFIRAMQKFQDTDYKKTLSYFQVAGIHGFPGNLPWDGSEGPSFSWEGDTKGKLKNHNLYCTHGLVTFPTWHRAYLLLFEQTLYSLMGEIIKEELPFKTSKEKGDWELERERWRLPYWDWARFDNEGSVPALFNTEQISIRAPEAVESASETVSNPLFRYQLKDGGALKKMGDLDPPYKVDDIYEFDSRTNEVTFEFPASQCSGTSRWGITSEPDTVWSGGVNKYLAVEAAIDKHVWYPAKDDPDPKQTRTLKVSDLVYRLLAESGESQTWLDFSSTAAPDPPRQTAWENWVSLEFSSAVLAKNAKGHMSQVPVAAFDPIFYMHHANIDRLTAIWQTLHPETWFTDYRNQPSADSPLTPFHHEFPTAKKEVRYFNSDNLRDWTQFGYQYDDLHDRQRKEGESFKDYSSRIKAYIKSTYTNTGHVLRRDSSNLLVCQSGNTYDDYIIDVLYDRLALNGNPYTIHFYLGSIGNSEVTSMADLATHTKHVGMVYNFSTPLGPVEAGQPPSCENCAQQRNAGNLSLAQIPLTIPLYHEAADDANHDINQLDPSTVEMYLRHQLHWIAVSTNGEQIPWEQLNNTKVFVLKGKAQHFEDDTMLSKYEHYTPMTSVTENKPAGASHVDYHF